MQKSRFERWLRNVYDTRDEEISCSECFDGVSHYVELELAGADAVAEMPQLKQHLDQCPACREEYETLRDLARLENEGGPPPPADLQDLIS